MAFALSIPLDAAQGPEFARDVCLLMAEATGLDRAQVLIEPDRRLTHEEEAKFLHLVAERRKGKSLAHVVGHVAFWNRRFRVTEDVLVPRPETETLIALALEEPFRDLLDLGTGSGVIAVTLLAECQDAVGIACDISATALAVAEGNARSHGVADRLHLEQSDWFECIGGDYDLIVSNPPYITEDAYADLAPEVLHEPRIALTPGGDGLAAYRAITAEAQTHLRPRGRLIVEIGYDQGAAVAELFREAGLDEVAVHADLDGRDRVVAGRST
ncbi:peptide chain release factor N(5)-glutamine methyltransferase [Hasllibacter sp. MH4015]|uniref:peptide chain release factor N(5)-glutamine methyltransferase n=1 Tax=Hasllibacter sp. MH4015 TaxID=2854029 RepID=UPI001CD2739B|nr:peptide chain release factor N(5)-glutamine methyltransferase [Hasllibacter sp. MH4015]